MGEHYTLTQSRQAQMIVYPSKCNMQRGSLELPLAAGANDAVLSRSRAGIGGAGCASADLPLMRASY